MRARAWAALPQLGRDQRAELQHPAPHRFIGDVEPTLGEHFLHVSAAQGESEIKPNRVLNVSFEAPIVRAGQVQLPESVQRRRDTHAALRLMRSCSRNRASHRSCWSPTSWAPTALQIELKTPIKSCGDESPRCSGSSRLDPRSVFSTSIPPPTTPSTINDISSLGPHFGSSEPKRPPGDKMRLPSHETGFDLANSLNPARYRYNAARRPAEPSAACRAAPVKANLQRPLRE